MNEPYLQSGEVLIKYETLYFQPCKNQRNICDVPSSNPRNSGMFPVKNNSLVISQLRLVGCHYTNLGAVAHGTLELYVFQFGRCYL